MPDGKVTYQDAPCLSSGKSEIVGPKGKPSTNIEKDPLLRPVVGVSEAKRAELLAEAEKAGYFSKEIRNKKIALGMSKELIALIRGSPDKINTTVNEHGTSEQWVYRYRVGGIAGDITVGTLYLYMENGKLVSVQKQ
jgi:hypothetical protein